MPNTNIGITPWRNETGRFSYPLISDILPDANIITDAYWVQFDSFVPVLKTIVVAATTITFNITTDSGDAAFVLEVPVEIERMDMYEPSYGRLIGRLTLGEGISNFHTNYIGKTIKVNTAFVASTVHGIPYNSGVFSIEGITGDVVFESDGNQFFTNEAQGVVFDAMNIPTCLDVQPLMTINGLSAPSITLVTNDVINWIPNGNGIKLELSAGSMFNTSVHPST